MLPWFVAGTLSELERRQVIFHLATCPECRNELAWFSKFRDSLREEVESLLCVPKNEHCTEAGVTDLEDRDLTARFLRLVPVALPEVGLRTTRISLSSSLGTISLGQLAVPQIRNHTLADWLVAAAGN